MSARGETGSSVRISGTVHTSRYFTEPSTHRPMHELKLEQSPGATAAVARRVWDNTPAAHLVAQRMARAFRPGQRATVTAKGWRFDARQQHLVLIDVDHAETEQQQPFHEPAQTAA